MNRKKIISDFLFNAGIWFTTLLIVWVHRDWKFSPQAFLGSAAFAISMSFGSIGRRELNRGGHQNVLHLFKRFLNISIGISVILFGVTMLYRTELLFIPLVSTGVLTGAGFAAMFPIALYLNRKQKKSMPQSAIADAN